MNLKKIDTKKEFYILNHISYNILHEVIRMKKWHFFININIFNLKELLFTSDNTKSTPFHQVCSFADHLTIGHLIKEGSQGGILTEEILTQTNAKGQNIFHLLIENKRLECQDLKQILILIKSSFNLKGLIASPDNFYWIPLAYYYLVKFKKGSNFNDWIKSHNEINDLLMPSAENFNFFTKQFVKEDYFFYLCTYSLINFKAKKKDAFIKDFETFARNYTFFNNKFLELAFNKKSEELLLFLLKKIPNLEINTYINNYDFGLTKKTHVLELLLQNNWVTAISLFFSKNQKKYFIEYQETSFYKYLDERSDLFRVFFENNGAEKSNPYFYFSYSVMDELIVALKSIKNESFYSKLADLTFKKMSEVLQTYSLEKREKILMNINIQILPKTENFQNSTTMANLFDLDDNQMIELFE